MVDCISLMAEPTTHPATDSSATSGGNATDDGVTDHDDKDATVKRFRDSLQNLSRQGESYVSACQYLHSYLELDTESFNEIMSDYKEGKMASMRKFLSKIRMSLEKCNERFKELQTMSEKQELVQLLHKCERIAEKQRQSSDKALMTAAGASVASLLFGMFTAAYSPPTTLSLGSTFASLLGTGGVLSTIVGAVSTVVLCLDSKNKTRDLGEVRESCRIDESSTMRLEKIKTFTVKIADKMNRAVEIVDEIFGLLYEQEQPLPVPKKISRKFKELRELLKFFSQKDFKAVIISGLNEH